VEAGSNTSTVTLRVVGGDEKGSLKSETIKYCDVYATKTGSSSDDWIYWQLVTHLLLITLTHWQYSTVSHLHNLQFTVAVVFHHELPS
jgi:extradiol dioxygenase family protein